MEKVLHEMPCLWKRGNTATARGCTPTQPNQEWNINFPFYLNQFVVWRQIGWRGDTPHQPPRVIEKGTLALGCNMITLIHIARGKLNLYWQYCENRFGRYYIYVQGVQQNCLHLVISSFVGFYSCKLQKLGHFWKIQEICYVIGTRILKIDSEIPWGQSWQPSFWNWHFAITQRQKNNFYVKGGNFDLNYLSYF